MSDVIDNIFLVLLIIAAIALSVFLIYAELDHNNKCDKRITLYYQNGEVEVFTTSVRCYSDGSHENICHLEAGCVSIGSHFKACGVKRYEVVNTSKPYK